MIEWLLLGILGWLVLLGFVLAFLYAHGERERKAMDQ